MVIDPWGTVISRASENEEIILADIDFSYQDSVRAKIPSLLNRRPDAYNS